MTSPADRLPLDLLLQHQLHAIEGPGIRISAAVVLSNRPPWLPHPDGARSLPEDGLQRLVASGKVRVKPVDYTGFSDPTYLRRFFHVVPSDVDKANSWSCDPDPTVHKCLDMWANVSNVSEVLHYGQPHYLMSQEESMEGIASNFQGMLNFLDECLSAPGSVSVCIFLDSDVFLYRSPSTERSLADLAAALFERNPQLIHLTPPSICDWSKDTQHGRCANNTFPWRLEDQNLLSSRYMVLNRQALQAALPLELLHADFLHPFEFAWTAALFMRAKRICIPEVGLTHEQHCMRSKLSGKMNCQGETFTLHPPDSHVQGASLEGLLNATVSSVAASGRGREASNVTRWGTEELLRRIEAGAFPSSGHAVWGCRNMNPVEKRIRRGMAWWSRGAA